MAQLKRWESPRRQGRNVKGKGGAARARQLKKREQQLRRKLKGDDPNPSQNKHKNQQTGGKEPSKSFPLFLSNISVKLNVRADGAGDATGRGVILPAIEQNL